MGTAELRSQLNGGQVALTTRSGNLDQPQTNWSPWSAAHRRTKGAPIASPAARFVQWRATLTADTPKAARPNSNRWTVAYLPKNVAPRIEQIEMTPRQLQISRARHALLVSTQQTLNLPPLGKTPGGRRASLISLDTTTTTPAMQLAKGYGWARAGWRPTPMAIR
jgi:hypothetical protein